METKASRTKFFLALVIFGLMGQIAWVVENMYFNVFIYEMFNASASQISFMVGASAVAATVTTLLMGALADKLGKRRIFICGGYILWGLSILSFCLIRVDVVRKLFPNIGLASTNLTAMSVCVTLVIIMDCVMTFFGSTANDAAFNAWLTDVTKPGDRGAAEGINAMMPLVAILVVFGGFMSFDLSKEGSWSTIFAIIGAAVIVIGIAGFFLIHDPEIKIDGNKNYFANIFYGFRPSVIKKNGRLYLYLIAFAIFNISIQIFMPYLILYYTESLKMANYVLIMAPAIILASIFTAFWGRVYDKKGVVASVIPALALLCIGYILLFFFRGTAMVFIGSLMMMCGYLAGMAVFGAAIRDYTPENRSGMFQGLRIVAQVLIPGVVGPAVGAAILKNAETITNSDGTTSFIPNQNIFLGALIVIFVLAGYLAFLFFGKSQKKVSETKEVTDEE
jgi:MFS family permease